MLPIHPLHRNRHLLISCLLMGCTSTTVSLRPDGSPGPQRCSEEAVKTMRILRLQPGVGAIVQIDANQTDQSPITLMDGPVESFLEEDMGTLPNGTRMYGQIWTEAPNVVIRYYEARPPDGDRIPICAVARSGGDVLKKLPASRPGIAVIKQSAVAMWIVDDFR
jgi:hypothetical protein